MNTNYEILSETTLPPYVPNSPISLAWNRRTDSPSIAISTEDQLDSKRRVRIFDGTTLEFKFMGRSEDGSGKVFTNMLHDHEYNTALTMLTWAGGETSNLMDCMQRKGKKGRNVFLEPNELQHSMCKLTPRNEGGVDWNSDSNIMALVLKCTNKPKRDHDNTIGEENENIQPFGKMQLYYRCNYHWYMKYEITYNPGTTISCLSFDTIRDYDLSISLR